ncbi:YidC/Oxa1 family membrane protein insertase [Patescibacteria group bacterium]
MFNQFIQEPINQGLVFFYHLLGDNLGLAIIAITLLIRFVLAPLTLPSLKSAKKIKDLKPDLDKLKKEHKDDKQALQMAQLELYKKHNINPAAGCLPQIINLIVLIGLYRVLLDFLASGNINGTTVNLNFLWMNLAEPDKTYAAPIVAGVIQFILALMLAPATDTAAEKTIAAQTKTKKDDKEAEGMSDMAQTMQQQMLFIMPLMTVVIALRFPSGVAIYWIITTLFSTIQQYFVSGLGGLEKYINKIFKAK